jgi:hypothetical protein
VIGVDDDHAKWLARPDGLVAKYQDLGLDAVRLTIPWRHGQTRPTRVRVYLHRAALLIQDGQRVVISVFGRPSDAPLDDQIRDALLLARCQPEVGGFFNFELLDEDRLAGLQSGVLYRDGTEKPSCDAFKSAVAQVRGGTVDCSAVTGAAAGPRASARAATVGHRSGLDGLRRRSRLGVAEADPAEVERRRDNPVPQRPEVRDHPQLDAGPLVACDEIAELDDLERSYRVTAQPVAPHFGIRPERLPGQAIRDHPRVMQPLEPALLDGVDSSCAGEELRVRRGRLGRSPEHRARALAREPVERKVSRVDRPDTRLAARRRRADVRIEPRDRGVLAHVPERMRALSRVRRRFSHCGDSSRPPP